MWIKEETPLLDKIKAEIILDKNAYGNLKVERGKPIPGFWWHYELHGEIISYVWLMEQTDVQLLYNQSGDESPEMEVAVRFRYQERGGYGFAAMRFGIAQARKMGYPAIFAKVKRENPKAVEVIKLSFAVSFYGLSVEGHTLNLEESLQYYQQVAEFTLRKDL